jgi:hypothetical protein
MTMELTPSNSPTDPFGQVTPEQQTKDSAHQGPIPEIVNQAHFRADTDSHQHALHHTLGKGRNQSAPGAHIHDGVDSLMLGPMIFDSTPGNEGKIIPSLSISGSRGGNAALASVIALLQQVINFTDNTTA